MKSLEKSISEGDKGLFNKISQLEDTLGAKNKLYHKLLSEKSVLSVDHEVLLLLYYYIIILLYYYIIILLYYYIIILLYYYIIILLYYYIIILL